MRTPIEAEHNPLNHLGLEKDPNNQLKSIPLSRTPITRLEFLRAIALFLPNIWRVDKLFNYSYLPEVIKTLETEKLEFALTIDDGWNKNVLENMLNNLKEANAHATFFLVARAARHNIGADLMQRLVNDGHEIGYHSVNHDDLGKLETWNSDQWNDDYTEWKKIMRNLLGNELFDKGFNNLVRAPYGLFNSAVLRMCKDNQLLPIGWSNSYFKNSENQLKLKVKAGNIIILHVRQPDDQVLTGILSKKLTTLLPKSITEILSSPPTSLARDASFS